MAEEKEETNKDDLGSTGLIRFVNSLHEIKLPELVKKNVLTATGKLIMGAVDIPLAWMESKAKQIRSESDAMAQVTIASGATTAHAFNVDPELQARSIDHWGSKLLKKQLNREEVYLQAMKDLENNPPKEDSIEEIDEDWLEQFGNLAESKSNENIKLILAKILAGEIRNAGSFSPRTLEAIKLLDSSTARIFHYLVSTALKLDGVLYPLTGTLEYPFWKMNYKTPRHLALQKIREFGLISDKNRDMSTSVLTERGVVQIGSCFFNFVEVDTPVVNRSRELNILKFYYSGTIIVSQFTTIGLELSNAVEPIISKDLDLSVKKHVKGMEKFLSENMRHPFRL